MKKTALVILALVISFSFSVSGQEKRALLIGIGDYPAHSEWNKIHGDNDIEIIREWLIKNDFNNENITSLINNRATYDAIISSFEQLINCSQKGDIIYIQFSGHGQQITDIDGDEEDGWDECWIPYDANKRYVDYEYTGYHHLSDDILFRYLSRLRNQVGNSGKIIVISDSCHSGGGSRSEDEFYRGTGDKFILPSDKTPHSDKPHSEKSVKWLYVAACKAYQTNYEYKSSDGDYCGRLTYIICHDESNYEKTPYNDVIKAWKKRMQEISKYPQAIEEEGQPNKYSNTIF